MGVKYIEVNGLLDRLHTYFIPNYNFSCGDSQNQSFSGRYISEMEFSFPYFFSHFPIELTFKYY